MNKKTVSPPQKVDSQVFSLNRKMIAKNLEAQVNPVVLVSKVVFAVLIIGFIGYFYDRMLRSIKRR